MSRQSSILHAVNEPFHEFLQSRLQHGPPSNDEILELLLPLFRQVQAAHEKGRVAPLAGLDAIQVNNRACWFADSALQAPRQNLPALQKIEQEESRALEITGHEDIRDDTGQRKVTNLAMGHRGEPVLKPVYLAGYMSWEHAIEHHDQLTDIFSLGLLTSSIALGLDLAEEEDLEKFVRHRPNLFQVNPRLHPVLAKAILSMTELHRRKRVQDMPSLIHTLTHYRLQIAAPDLQFNRIAGFKEAAYRDRRKLIQQRLRDRLFEISRRNRLLYFRPTLQMLNLTIGSVPLMLDYKRISPDALCTWQGEFAHALSHGESVQLGKYLRFEDAPYLPGVLDQIRNQEARDRTEYGFSQLRLTVAFLRWHNLKELKEERIVSPLVLLPVQLEKKKGVRDSYTLTALTSEAEINPTLRYHLRQIYGLALPETIDLSKTTLQAFYELLQQQILASEPGIHLRLLERPQIKLVHERARARLEVFRRKKRLTGKGVQTLEGIDYSYSRENFQPLGLQLFLKKVRPAPAPLQVLAGGAPRVRQPDAVAPLTPAPSDPLPGGGPAVPGGADEVVDPAVRERNLFELQQESESNPYTWDFDLCSLTLGNFNYRKMSLVRDYNTLLEGDWPNAAFDAIFPERPRSVEVRDHRPLSPEEGYSIVHSDPTQMAAVTRARSGASYIIQGPPGTGKSQTITNLIADYVARGKRVLFVCAKRAAIDVVYHRLKQCGLDPLCSLIHDSQSDKKAFILDLKSTYEDGLARPDGRAAVEEERTALVKQLRFDLDTLDRFATAMAQVDGQDGVSVRQIYSRLIEHAGHLPTLNDALAEALPGYGVWNRFGKSVHALSRILREAGGDPLFAHSGLKHLSGALLHSDRPLQAITQALDTAQAPLQELLDLRQTTGLPAAATATLASWNELIAYASQVKSLADKGQLPLLNAHDPSVAALRETLITRRKLDQERQAAARKTENWIEKIPAGDVAATLEQARHCEGSLFRFLMPGFWQLRKIIRARYRFNSHVVAPSWRRILEDLQADYAAADAYQQAIETQNTRYQTDDVAGLLARVEALHGAEATLSKPQRALRELLVTSGAGGDRMDPILGASPLLKSLRAILEPLLAGSLERDLAGIAVDLASLRSALPVLPEALPVLTDLLSGPREFTRALAEHPWTADEFEAALLAAALARAYRRDRSLPRLDGRALGEAVERIKTHYTRWMSLNAELVRERVRGHFLERVALSNQAAAQVPAPQRELKRVYTKGRRELEHEFGKVMRFRSIRDLADDETGQVVADLKPIWLMSPLSVSDTLPMVGAPFDVVIFDEASQIPLEESIPALYRAAQIIVVGDEKQLPPTDFFSSKSQEDEEEPAAEDGLDAIGYELNSDSFLTQSAENLPSTMLCWHYRSRSEALISFSNSAFYSRKLLTVPDAHLHPATQPIVAQAPADGDLHAAHVLDRPVSFHFLPNGLYADRRNHDEAQYIARLVRGLLQAKTGRSIGVVAFSEAQQGEIEAALEALGHSDPAFDELLQAEMIREEHEQFCGLFVKNLENVQGDERDIIIMSVCYGYDAQKKMLMNFGPINKNGGEKRLNVVFSRAKCHMALVSSIRSAAITNEYNDGANCLKRYIAYADALSSGQADQARRILNSMVVDPRQVAEARPVDPLALAIATALRKRGFDVDAAVGQSDFRCDLAIKKPGEQRYRLGVLLDPPAPAGADRGSVTALEQSILRPGVLVAFGWQVVQVYAKDWHHDSAAVLVALERALADPDPVPPTQAEPEPQPVPPQGPRV